MDPFFFKTTLLLYSIKVGPPPELVENWLCCSVSAQRIAFSYLLCSQFPIKFFLLFYANCQVIKLLVQLSLCKSSAKKLNEKITKIYTHTNTYTYLHVEINEKRTFFAWNKKKSTKISSDHENVQHEHAKYTTSRTRFFVIFFSKIFWS
jgi:hypothetical protein